ncbi:hypothetical protein BGW37DRAFT_500646, partial [Umbelopsis sp. PMI_123]
MGISWAIDSNPSPVKDMPSKPELSSRGTIMNRAKDYVANLYRDTQQSLPFMNGSSQQTSQVTSNRDPRNLHYQNRSREQTRGTYHNHTSLPNNPYPPAVQYSTTATPPEHYSSRSTHHRLTSTSSSPDDQYEKSTPISEAKVSSQKSISAYISSASDNNRHDVSQHEKDRSMNSSGESSRNLSRKSPREFSKEPSATQVSKWVATSRKDIRPIKQFTCTKGSILKSGPTTLADHEMFSQAIKNNQISWDSPMVFAIDFVYDVPVFPPPTVSLSQQPAAHRPPSADDEERSHKKPRTEPSTPSPDIKSSKQSKLERSTDQNTGSSINSRIETSSQPRKSLGGGTNGINEFNVARSSASTITKAGVASSSTEPVHPSEERKTKNTIIVIKAILDKHQYCYMPFRMFEMTYDRLRVNMSPAMTGTELKNALQSDHRTEISKHVVLTMFPGNPLARYIRLKVKDLPKRSNRDRDNVDYFRRQFIADAAKVVFPGTIISIYALVYLMESLRPDPMSDTEVRCRLGNVDLLDFLVNSTSAWRLHRLGNIESELVAFNPV